MTATRSASISGFPVYMQTVTAPDNVSGDILGSAPLIYMPVDPSDTGERTIAAFRGLCTERGISIPTFHLVAVGVEDWNATLCPWDAPKVFAKGDDFGHGAAGFLNVLTGSVVPAVEAEFLSADAPSSPSDASSVVPALPVASASSTISAPSVAPDTPPVRYLAGYSLAGLFTLWASFNTDAFQKIALVSGSFWYPNLVDYAIGHAPDPAVTHAYLSLGDREERTPNPQIQHVRKNAELLTEELERKGLATTFALNRGNHFQNEPTRIAKALLWMRTE